MRVLQAQTMGLCFGVRDALAVARAQPSPEKITIHGQLVHNELIQGGLRQQGFAMSPEGGLRDLPNTEQVMITAHGVSDRERQRLREAGKDLIDTTCPLVTRAHAAAVRLAGECQHVVILGKPGHVEVLGLAGDLPSSDVAATVDAARHYGVARLGVVCQTTFPSHRAQQILAAIASLNPDTDVRFANTTCEPTRQRIQAVQDLLGQVDAMVVVGGANSNNTRELVQMCKDHGTPAHHVQGPDDLDPRWFRGYSTVGLTAGTSTLDQTVAAVFAKLNEFDGGELSPRDAEPAS